MKKNIIHVIYPSQKTIAFVHESDETVETILELVFGMFNHGSCQESELFLKSKIRSLSVNDIVCVNVVIFNVLRLVGTKFHPSM
jgi:hypothetical protein